MSNANEALSAPEAQKIAEACIAHITVEKIKNVIEAWGKDACAFPTGCANEIALVLANEIRSGFKVPPVQGPVPGLKDVIAEFQKITVNPEASVGSLGAEGAAYLGHGAFSAAGADISPTPPWFFPKDPSTGIWSPQDARGDLVRGVALGLKEIERFDQTQIAPPLQGSRADQKTS